MNVLLPDAPIVPIIDLADVVATLGVFAVLLAVARFVVLIVDRRRGNAE